MSAALRPTGPLPQIEGQILTAVDVDALIRQATSTLLDGMRPAP